jgi:hypothetical protein
MRYVGFAILALIVVFAIWSLGSVNNIRKYEEEVHAKWT